MWRGEGGKKKNTLCWIPPAWYWRLCADFVEMGKEKNLAESRNTVKRKIVHSSCQMCGKSFIRSSQIFFFFFA